MITKITHPFVINDDNSISVDCPKIGKITGTTLSAVLGNNPWQTPFSVACRLLGIYEDDISDNAHIKAGVVLEPIIMGYLDNSGRLPNKQAEEIFGKREGNHEEWAQDFEHEVFGGHIDGMTPDGAIVECKTTTDPSTWLKGEIPEHYWIQASLYAKFLNTDTIHFTVGILTQENLNNPYTFTPNEDNVKVYTVGLHPDIDDIMQRGIEWYNDYLKDHRTPIPNLNNETDSRIFNQLYAQKCSEDEITSILELYESIMTKIDALSKEIKALESSAESYKAQLITYMDVHETKIKSNKYRYQVTTSTRKSADADALKRDGLFDRYSKETIVKSMRKYAL